MLPHADVSPPDKREKFSARRCAGLIFDLLLFRKSVFRNTILSTTSSRRFTKDRPSLVRILFEGFKSCCCWILILIVLWGILLRPSSSVRRKPVPVYNLDLLDEAVIEGDGNSPEMGDLVPPSWSRPDDQIHVEDEGSDSDERTESGTDEVSVEEEENQVDEQPPEIIPEPTVSPDADPEPEPPPPPPVVVPQVPPPSKLASFYELDDSSLSLLQPNEIEELIKLTQTDFDRASSFLQRLRRVSSTRNLETRVVEAFLHAWNSYKAVAWGHDEVRPVSNETNDSWGGFGVTMLDSLDTLCLMGLHEELNHAAEFVSRLNFDKDVTVSFFETSIRHLAGLLAGFECTGNRVFLDAARNLGDRMLPAFDSPSGYPYGVINLKTGVGRNANWVGGRSILSEVGVFVEWHALSLYTGEDKYYRLARRALETVRERASLDSETHGLYPVFLDIVNGTATPTENHGRFISLGGGGDSFYEYLLKEFVQSGDKESLFMYFDFVGGMKKHLVRRTKPTTTEEDIGLTYIGNLNEREGEMEHLVCFLPATLILHAMEDPKDNEWELARELLDTCLRLYSDAATGLAPDTVIFRDSSYDIRHPKFMLRPETLESLFYAYRFTGEQRYFDWVVRIFESIEEHCRVSAGYSGLTDVNKPGSHDNSMQSFFLSETLKYIYLTVAVDSEELFNFRTHYLTTEDEQVPREAPNDSKMAFGNLEIFLFLLVFLFLVVQETTCTFPGESTCIRADVTCICTTDPGCAGGQALLDDLIDDGDGIEIPASHTLYIGDGPYELYNRISYSGDGQSILPFPGETVQLRFHLESATLFAGRLIDIYQRDNTRFGSESNGGKFVVSYEGAIGDESIDEAIYVFQASDVQVHNVEIVNTGPCCDPFAPNEQRTTGITVYGPLTIPPVILSNVKITNVRQGIWLDAFDCNDGDPDLVVVKNVIIDGYCGKAYNLEGACFTIDGGWLVSAPADDRCNVPDPALQTPFYVNDAHRFSVQNVFVERHVNASYDGGSIHVFWGESDRGTDKIFQNNFFQCDGGFDDEMVVFVADDMLDGDSGIFKIQNNVFSGCTDNSDGIVDVLIDGTQSMLDIPQLFSSNYIGSNFVLEHPSNWNSPNNQAYPQMAIEGGSATKPYPYYKLSNVDVCNPGGTWVAGESPATDVLGNPRNVGGQFCVGPVEGSASSRRCFSLGVVLGAVVSVVMILGFLGFV